MDEHTRRTLRNLLQQLGPDGDYSRRLQNANSTMDLNSRTNPSSVAPSPNRKIITKSSAPLVFHSPSSMPCVVMPGSITSTGSRLGVHGSSTVPNSQIGMNTSGTSPNSLVMSGNSRAPNIHLNMIPNPSNSAASLGAAQLSLIEHSNVLGVSAISDQERNLYICDDETDNQMSGNLNSIFDNTSQISRQSFTMRRTRTNIPYSVKCKISKMAEESPRITQGEIAQIFGIDRTTVSKILKKRKLYIESSSPDSPSKVSRLAEHESLHHDLEETLSDWYAGMKEKNISVTREMVADAARNLADVYAVPKSTIDSLWITSFCHRHNISSFREDFTKLDYTAAMHRNKISTQERRMPPSAARGSASEAPVVGQNLSQPKPTSQPIPNKSCNKISREGNKFSASGAVPSLSESAQVTMPDQVTVKEEPEIQELGPEEALNRELGTLEKFREQQKEIEEANKHKKALLAKTLSERQKKARMEAEKLTHIQKELMILDNLLSADVTVVRNRIENASRDFLEATRRYDRAEKEFIEAKLDLQKKSELKEQLTEHLYTIIHQNEIRKAKKLSDLMTELDMETKGEQLCIGNLPPLSAFSSMGMVKVTSPTSPKTPESDSPKVSHSEQKVASPVSSDNKVESTTTVSNATSDDQVRIKTDNSSGESLCLPNDASNDTENTHSEQNQFQISQTRSEENLDNISCPEDFTVNANVEQPSNSSCTDDSSSYNSALSAGADISQSPKHSQNNDSNVAMPSSWTLDSVHIKEEPIT
ncbi:serine-rich adhesin for platelets-like isoform X1 [Argopecten irradians]|uniref:serine-rich adhesin for platelets-like isoform X1 n=1 Tax=Argopecten irradians TaxID=31199 RepID=UPI00370FF2D0